MEAAEKEKIRRICAQTYYRIQRILDIRECMARTTGALDSWQLFSTFAWLSGGERYTENALRPKSIHAQVVRVSCDYSVHTPYTYTLRIGNRTHSRKAWNEISTREPQVQRKSLSPFFCSLCLSQIFYARVPWKRASAEIGFVCWTSKQQFQIFLRFGWERLYAVDGRKKEKSTRIGERRRRIEMQVQRGLLGR